VPATSYLAGRTSPEGDKRDFTLAGIGYKNLSAAA
jgi:hypothetical protein